MPRRHRLPSVPEVYQRSQVGWKRPAGDRVKISHPVSVTPTECSNCAESERSLVTAVQSSSRIFVSGPAEVDHRLDGEEHPRLQHRPRPPAAVVQHVRRGVEHPAEAVAAEVADHRAAVRLGEALDRRADVAEGVARPHLGDALHQRVVGDVDQPLGLAASAAPATYIRLSVAVPAVDDHRHVDVEDVAVAQALLRRDAVADDVVDRDAGRVPVALVADRRRDRARPPGPCRARAVSSSSVVTPGATSGAIRSRMSAASPPGRAHAGEVLRARGCGCRPCSGGRAVNWSKAGSPEVIVRDLDPRPPALQMAAAACASSRRELHDLTRS